MRKTLFAALLVFFVTGTIPTTSDAAIVIADGSVEWTTTTGEAATSARPDSDAFF